MGEDAVIRSRSNALLGRARAVLAGRDGARVLLEGERLVRDALAAGHACEAVLVAESRAELAAELAAAQGAPVRLVADELLARASSLRAPPGVLALAPAPADVRPEELAVGPRALFLVVAGVADPGNLGALARSAEAAGAGALLVVAGGASPWNPKALRGSMGSLLRLPVARVAQAERAAALLHARGLRSLVAATRGGPAPSEIDWSGPIALWVGGETGRGTALPAGLEPVTVPMAGGVESLNVTVAASLLLFAAGRNDPRGEGGR